MPNHDVSGFDFDKDLRILGNKRYSPKTCSFVPKAISCLFSKGYRTKQKAKMGVSPITYRGRKSFIARVSIDNRIVNLGTFGTEDKARQVYLEARLANIKRLAKWHRHEIHSEVYRTLMGYTARQLKRVSET